MNVVGKMGSLISQGIYSVATPFHPFGGVVDIIVVEQEDGTYRSTPWYVRFGKFQGIIKGAEKVVTISVNGAEADFHMYLDHSGQAYFLREIEITDTQSSGRISIESSPHKFSQDDSSGNNAEVQESVYEEHREAGENDEDSYHRDEHSSTGNSCCISPRFSSYSYGNLEDVEVIVNSSNGSNSEMVLISVDGHVLTAPIFANEDESTNYVQLSNPQFHLGPGEGSREELGAIFGDLDASAFKDSNTSGNLFKGPKDAKGDSICNVETREDSQCGIVSGEDNNLGGSVYLKEVCETGRGDMDTCSNNISLSRTNDDLFKSCLL